MVALGQSQVYGQPVMAIAGDFASKNPYWTYDAGPGGLVAGIAGASVGLFAWVVPPLDSDGTPSFVNNFGTGNTSGFMHRDQQALIENYLGAATMLVPVGFPVALMTGGDFWVVNNGTTLAQVGQKAYASFATGQASFAATASPTAGAVATSWSIAAETATFAGSITGNLLTVTGAVTGTIYPGSILSGGTVATNTTIGAQQSGTTGGDGTYFVSIPEQTVASATLTASYGLLTLTTVSSGVFAVGQTLTGATTGVTAGTTITNLLTGTGASSSTMTVNLTQTSSSGSEGNLTGAANVETKWYAASAGLPGELVKITSHVGSQG